MLPISSLKIPQTSNTSTRSNLLTQIDAPHEQANGEGQSIVQASENCVVSNQLYGENHTVTTNFYLTDSDPNTKSILEILRLERLNAHAEATRYKPLAQLGTQIEELRTVYLNVLEEIDEIRDSLALYIPSEGQETADSQTSFTLIDKVRDFLSSNKKVLLLLGEAGSGKSTFNRYLTRTLWEEYPQSSTAPIPLFIALAEHRPSCDDLIESYLLEHGFTSEAIAMLRKEKRLVFILDGFDETQDRTQAFYTQNKLDHWKNAQVIISSRPEYLGENYRSQFQKRGQTSALQEYWLSTISDDWITAYIQKYIQHTQRTGWNLKRYQDALNHLPTLKEAIRRPFLLRMALDLLPDLAESKSAPMTRIALYDAFISRWWNRSEERLLHIKLTDEEEKARCKLGQHLVAKGLRASQEMAIALTQKRLIQASYDPEKDEIIPEAWRTYLDENEVEKRLLLFNAPLIHQGQHYRFIHKSIQDYCVARAICSPQFNSAQPDVDAVLNRFLLVDEPLILDFLVERVKQHFSFKAHLHAWIEVSKDAGAPMTVGAANAITVLVRAGVQFNGVDLKEIRIPGANLSNGVFEHTQFQGADLSEVTLRGAWLCGANMHKANLQDIEFGEMPGLEVGGMVMTCSYSPDGRWLAVGISFVGCKLYRKAGTQTQQKLELKYTLGGSFLGILNSVYNVAFSSDSQLLATVGGSGRDVRLWSVETGKLERKFVYNDTPIESISFSQDGQWLVSGDEEGGINLEIVQPEPRTTYYRLGRHEGKVRSVSISPDGGWLASGGNDKKVNLWKLEHGEVRFHQTLEEYHEAVRIVSFSPDGKWLVSGSDDMKMKIWKLESAGASLHQTHEEIVTSISFSSDGKWLASSGGGDSTVKLWELRNSKVMLCQTFEGHRGLITSVSFSPDGKWLASGSLDKTLKFWALRNEEVLSRQTFEGQRDKVCSVSISPDGKWLASGSADEKVKLWELGSDGVFLRQTLEGHNDWVVNLSISCDGQWLASGSWDKTVKLWKLGSAEGAALHQTLEGHNNKVRGVSISSDSKWLVSGGDDKTLKLWELSDRGALLRRTLEGHSDYVRSVSISPNGKWLASGSDDTTVKLWKMDLESAEVSLHQTLESHSDEILKEFSRVFNVLISPDSRWLASGNENGTVKLWRLSDDAGASAHQTLKGHKLQVLSMSFSPDSKWLASGSCDCTVKLWLLNTGECKAMVQCFIGQIHSVVWQEFTESSAKIVVGGSENTIRIFQLERKKNDWKSNLYWTSNQNELAVSELIIKGARNLSPENKRLITQRQRNLNAKISVEFYIRVFYWWSLFSKYWGLFNNYMLSLIDSVDHINVQSAKRSSLINATASSQENFDECDIKLPVESETSDEFIPANQNERYQNDGIQRRKPFSRRHTL
ncbi:MAG: WD40 repeat [Glomeribacter sp. 1016415]|nr:WD40 repeat [Glomeribacter sp. 1016415]